MAWNLVRGLIAGLVVVGVAELAPRFPRLGALLLTLPIVGILAFLATWIQHRDLTAISQLARETLVLVPLGLPLFVPLAFAERLGLGFAAALLLGLSAAVISIGLWFWVGPKLF